jgi:erythromycin esterase-like protein
MTHRQDQDFDFEASELIRHSLHPLVEGSQDYIPLMEMIGDARIVLIGEASHGTHEFYRERARLTQQLILEKGFNAVAVEADWPDSYEVNRYVRGIDENHNAKDALNGFQRFPTWMWRNQDVLEFIAWLKGYNDEQEIERQKVGFYGLDLYSMFTSIQAVIQYLEKLDPEAAAKARNRYACFDRFERDLQDYGLMSAYGLSKNCEDEVVKQLIDLRQHAWDYLHGDGQVAQEAFFNAEMNARLARNAEQYYRSMFRGRMDSWNLRDTHMFETLTSLMNHLSPQGDAKIVVWAHNSHIGNASATELGRVGEFNIGQLAKERFKDFATLIGFSTYTGTVTAASDWDAPTERKQVRKAIPHSYEDLFHQVGIPNFLLLPNSNPQLYRALQEPRLQRAIGVIYQPRTERQSHYFEAVLPRQFDAVIHMDETQAVEPLEKTVQWRTGEEFPETFPHAL